MKCASCDLPLSPTHTRSSCPRCGRPISGQQGGIIGHVPTAVIQPQAFVPQQYNSNNQSEIGIGVQQQDRNTPWQTAPASFPQPSSPLPMSSATVPPSTHTTGDHLGEHFFQAPTATPGQFGFQAATSSPAFPQIPQTPPQTDISRKAPIPFGFTISSLCVVTGGLILVLVYFLSLGALAADNAALQSAATHTKKVPTIISLPSPTTIPATSTPTYPAQQYVDNVVMASNVVTTTAQPTIVSNTFKLKQKMYVTFEVHTHNAGGICLVWYINNKMLTSFAFPVASSTSAYSFAYASTVGAGNVEIYWSATASCLDLNKLLAQKAQFSITA